jgi:hypothetical protein
MCRNVRQIARTTTVCGRAIAVAWRRLWWGWYLANRPPENLNRATITVSITARSLLRWCPQGDAREKVPRLYMSRKLLDSQSRTGRDAMRCSPLSLSDDALPFVSHPECLLRTNSNLRLEMFEIDKMQFLAAPLCQMELVEPRC